ncbi:hypothetical protein [Methylobacterium sp. 37f]|uniref:hypothetical protein n=1 Tax=Methylobacterium sp. 37f TaxID=2817058 RepID=UPI001FFD9742|nr:hypothetical protein [Methylobacterium sp. 37f]MCK2052585.1 hypothetical protein [Methylobacterium sp. 37f]
MTELLAKAFLLLGQMPAAAQDDIARALLGMADVADVQDIEPKHREAVLEGLAQAERGAFADASVEATVAAAFARAVR